MSRYPDECPVFMRKEDGRLMVLRPSMESSYRADAANIGDEVYVESGALVSDSPLDAWFEFDAADLKPLTPAARELLAWVRQ